MSDAAAEPEQEAMTAPVQLIIQVGAEAGTEVKEAPQAPAVQEETEAHLLITRVENPAEHLLTALLRLHPDPRIAEEVQAVQTEVQAVRAVRKERDNCYGKIY